MRFGTIRFFFRNFEAALLKAKPQITAPIVSRKRTIRGTKTLRAPKPLSVTDICRQIAVEPGFRALFCAQMKIFVGSVRFVAKRRDFAQDIPYSFEIVIDFYRSRETVCGHWRMFAKKCPASEFSRANVLYS